jgi:hypothetical protein
VEGRGTKRQSDSFSGNKAGFVSLGRPRKNSVSPQGAKVAEANVSQASLGVAESPRRAEASSFERKHNLVGLEPTHSRQARLQYDKQSLPGARRDGYLAFPAG